MSSRTLVGLLAALAVLVALAVAVSLSQRQPAGAGTLLLPDLKAALNDINRISIRTAGDKTVATLERQEDRWLVADRSGYPADLGRIRRNLIVLAEAIIVEEKTSNPDLYNKLGVDDVAGEGATGVQLDLTIGDKTTSVIIGQTGVGGGDRAYVRRADEAASWMVSGNFNLAKEATDWLDRSVANIASARVHTVAISHPDGTAVRVEKANREATDFGVQNIPKGREPAFATVGNAIGGALADLTLDNVTLAQGFNPGDVKPVLTRFETFDGLVVEATSWKTPDGVRFAFAARADQTLAERFAPNATAEAVPAAAPADQKPAAEATAATEQPQDKTPSFAEVSKEADELNARLSGWIYTLADFKAEQFTKKLEDLLQPREPGK